MRVKTLPILRRYVSKIRCAVLVTTIRTSCVFIVALMSIVCLVERSHSQTRRRPKPIPIVTPSPSPTPDIQASDGISSAYDEASNVTLVVSKELLLYDDASKGAVNPLRVTMNLVTTYQGRPLAPNQSATDPLVRLLFNYRYFVAKYDIGEPRDFAIFTGLSRLEASGNLTFVRRQNSGNDVITTMQAAIRASEFDNILQAIKTARSVSVLLGRDTFVLSANHLELIEKFLARTPHPSIDAAQIRPAPSKCDLTVAQAPALRGLRLAESLDGIIRRFPAFEVRETANKIPTQSKVNHSSLDVVFGTYYALTPQNPASGRTITDTWSEVLADSRFFPDFEGVSKLHLEFIDRQLIAIRVEYKDEIKWQSIDEFVTASSTALGLATQWKSGPLLTCNGFTIQASSSLHPKLEMRDTAAQTAARQREDELRKKEEDKRKSTFRP